MKNVFETFYRYDIQDARCHASGAGPAVEAAAREEELTKFSWDHEDKQLYKAQVDGRDAGREALCADFRPGTGGAVWVHAPAAPLPALPPGGRRGID